MRDIEDRSVKVDAQADLSDGAYLICGGFSLQWLK